jgi:predicted DNA binding CopG/RHH family protein
MMSKVKLDKEEKKLLTAFEAGEYESVLTPSRKKQIAEIAATTFKKDKRINIRISSRDLEAIQKRAIVEGIPYQTLVSSILHKYVSGSLHDVTANKRMQSDAAKLRR